MSNLVLDNKFVAGGVFGFEIAKQFASQGARLLICGRNSASLKKATKILNSLTKRNSCDYLVCDVSVEKDIKSLVKKTLDKYGSISILVNNAGIQGDKGKLEEANINNWKKTIEVNLIGSVLMCKEIIPIFKN